MTQFSTPSSSHHKYHFSPHLFSEFHSSSNPLYLSYFLFFFSPFLLELISFLSPLFLTTFGILLASVIPDQNVDQEVVSLEALQLYSIVFDVGDHQVQHHHPTMEPQDAAAIMTLATLLHKKEDLGDQLEGKEEEEVTKSESVKLGTKVEEKQEREGSSNASSDDKELIFSSQRRSQSDGGMMAASPWSSPSSLGSYGSMRKEKEWRRTLACKLFEERHNNTAAADKSGEGMDLLWETYEEETESSSAADKVQAKTTKSKSRKKCGRIVHHSYVDDDNGEQEEEEMGNDHGGKLCCLQALKFSTGKMKLGMGKPNLLKISKAIKGIGWLHHVTTNARVHSRKKLQPLY